MHLNKYFLWGGYLKIKRKSNDFGVNDSAQLPKTPRVEAPPEQQEEDDGVTDNTPLLEDILNENMNNVKFSINGNVSKYCFRSNSLKRIKRS